MMINKKMSYILITPARNEEANIIRVLKSLTAQTYLPKRWIIVSDGSTDATDEIVAQYSKEHPWIVLISRSAHNNRDFASKVNSFNAGYSTVQETKFDVIGNLDADISFGQDYFEFLLGKLEEHPEIGVIGTPFVEGSAHYDYKFTSIEHVSGACQLFRKECFEEIGGFVPRQSGGEDLIAVTMARMKGWKTRTYTERTCTHHRKMGTGDRHFLKARFRDGQTDYYLGGDPLWELFRFFYQLSKKPYLIGALCLLSGYTVAAVSKGEDQISKEFRCFRRTEQRQRLEQFFKNLLTPSQFPDNRQNECQKTT